MLKNGLLRHVTSRHVTLDLFWYTIIGPPSVLRTYHGGICLAVNSLRFLFLIIFWRTLKTYVLLPQTFQPISHASSEYVLGTNIVSFFCVRFIGTISTIDGYLYWRKKSEVFLLGVNLILLIIPLEGFLSGVQLSFSFNLLYMNIYTPETLRFIWRRRRSRFFCL